jgi:hypothetical protein
MFNKTSLKKEEETKIRNEKESVNIKEWFLKSIKDNYVNKYEKNNGMSKISTKIS